MADVFRPRIADVRVAALAAGRDAALGRGGPTPHRTRDSDHRRGGLQGHIHRRVRGRVGARVAARAGNPPGVVPAVPPPEVVPAVPPPEVVPAVPPPEVVPRPQVAACSRRAPALPPLDESVLVLSELQAQARSTHTPALPRRVAAVFISTRLASGRRSAKSLSTCRWCQSSTPATHATMQVVSKPPIIARSASRDRSGRRSGASPL